jgi:hypothetical protein
MIYKVDTEGGTLPSYNSHQIHVANNSCKTFLHLRREGFYVPINFSIVHEQAPYCGDRRRGRHRMRIVSASEQHSL